MYRIWWAGVVILCILFIAVRFNPDRLQTNLFDLLPKKSKQQIENDAIDAYAERLSRKTGVLIGARTHTEAVAIAEQADALLQQSGIFSQITAKVSSEQLKSVYLTYQPYRYSLLSSKSVTALQSSDQWLIGRLLNALASPVTGLNSATILDDPFLLLQDYLAKLPTGNPHIHIKNGYSTVEYNGNVYILIAAEFNASPFDQSLQEKYVALQARLDKEIPLRSGEMLEVFGVIRHALENRKLAQSEMTVIGSGSLIGILALFLLVFRQSLRQLLILLPIITGMVFALAVSLLLFEHIHLISVVFGVSLIGVSIDYAIHYSCANSSLSAMRSGKEAISKVRAALTLGLLTSIAGYLTLTTTEFPALRQMATIAIAGLVGAYLTVVLWLPALISKPQQVRELASILTNRYSAWIDGLRKAPVWLIISVLVVLFVVIIATKQSNDDIKMMRANLPHLDVIDTHFKQVLAEYPNSQFILVSGDSEEQLLANETQLVHGLRHGQTLSGRIEAISDWLPSREQQLRNLEVLRKAIIGNQNLERQILDAGIPAEILQQYQQGLMNENIELLAIDRFIQSPLGRLKSDVWLGKINTTFYSIVMLYGFDDLLPLKKTVAQFKFAYFADRLSTVSETFRFYRNAIEEISPFVIGVVFLLLLLRYGVNGAFRVVSAPVIAAMASFIMVQSLLDQYNLFTIFGLIITIAISIDYAIFIREARESEAATFLAITLAGITTILAFGLLALSNTPALNTFGLTLLFGIVFAYFITPVVVVPGRRPK